VGTKNSFLKYVENAQKIIFFSSKNLLNFLF